MHQRITCAPVRPQVQQLGRTHRSNQAQPPRYVIASGGHGGPRPHDRRAVRREGAEQPQVQPVGVAGVRHGLRDIRRGKSRELPVGQNG